MNEENEINIIQDKTFETIKSAVNKMVDFIKPTFGPASNKVIIDKMQYKMTVDDGVQIARDFELSDPAENAVVRLVREAAVRTNDRVGDGTTSSLIMLQAIINEAGKHGRRDAHNVVKELKKGVKEAVAQLRKSAKKVSEKDDLKKVSLVSFDDEDVAEMLSDIYAKLGKDALINVDKSPKSETTMETSEGVKIETGYVSPYMINNPDRMEAVIEKPRFLITDYRLLNDTDVVPIFEKMLAKTNEDGTPRKQIRELVIICENIEDKALSAVIINSPQIMRQTPEGPKAGNIFTVAIAAPKVEDREVFLNDMAILTGATVFSEAKGNRLENLTLEDLGTADKFICRRDESIIIKPGGDAKYVSEQVFNLQAAIAIETVDKKKKHLEYRLARFTGTIATIKVGAATDNEQKALKYKVEDAVSSLKSACSDGVVCGAGISLASLKTSSPILNEAMKYPYRQLFVNMGMESKAVIPKEDDVLNVITKERGKFMDVGVIDPVDTLIAGVESAVSIASVLLTSSGILVEAPKRKKDNE